MAAKDLDAMKQVLGDDSSDESEAEVKNRQKKMSGKEGLLERGRSEELDDDELERLLSESDVDIEELATRKLGYGRDFFKDQAEKDKMEQMPEIERENLLYNRGEERRELLETLRLKHEQKQEKRAKENPAKSPEKTISRQRSSSISSLSDGYDNESYTDRRSRSRNNIQKPKKRKRRRYSDDSFIDDNSDSEFANFSAKHRYGSTRSDHGHGDEDDSYEKLITIDDARRMQVTRNMIVKYVEEPFLRELVRGFVRVSTGDDSIYRLCEIVDIIETRKEYRVDDMKLVDRLLLLKYGKTEQEYKISVVSNQLVTNLEYNAWKTKMQEDNQEIQTQRDAEFFQKRIHDNVFNHVYTDEEVRQKVARKKARRKRRMKLNYTIEKAELERRIKYYENDPVDGDVEQNRQKVLELKQELEELIRDHDLLVRNRRRNLISPGKVNERNRLQNIREKEKISQERNTSDKTEEHVENPYARQPCRPKTLWSTASPTNKALNSSEGNQESSKNDSSTPSSSHNQNDSRSKKSDGSEVITERLARAAELNKRRELNKSTSVHNEVKLKIDLKDKNASSSRTVSSPQKRKLLVPQKLKVQPKKFMSLAEYIRQQES